MLGMMDGACSVGEGCWLWLPFVIVDMTGSLSTCSLSLAIVVERKMWWCLCDAGEMFGAFKFPLVYIIIMWDHHRKENWRGRQRAMIISPLVSSPAVSWNLLIRDEVFFGQPRGCFSPSPLSISLCGTRMPMLECWIFYYAGAAPFTFEFDGERPRSAWNKNTYTQQTLTHKHRCCYRHSIVNINGYRRPCFFFVYISRFFFSNLNPFSTDQRQLVGLFDDDSHYPIARWNRMCVCACITLLH